MVREAHRRGHEIASHGYSHRLIYTGFMDYMADPRKTIEKVLSVTKGKAFFSFQTDGGILAWQRKLRYKQRCPRYLYNQSQLDQLFSSVRPDQVRCERIERDYFVTVTM